MCWKFMRGEGSNVCWSIFSRIICGFLRWEGRKKKEKNIPKGNRHKVTRHSNLYGGGSTLALRHLRGFLFFLCGFVGFRVPDILLQDHTHLYLDWISVCDKQRDIAHPGSMEQMGKCAVCSKMCHLNFRAANSIPLIKQKQMLYLDLIIISWYLLHKIRF